MLYHFPDLDTLRLAITSGAVPQEVSLAPAIGGVDEEGHVWLQPSVALPAKAKTALRKLGVEAVKANGDLQAEEMHCWLQVLPVVREAVAPAPSAQVPVLFELPDSEQLPELVGEMLRLGNDRQSFRWLKDDESNRVLLRVVGPPYYSLLRALEGSTKAPRAYLERAPHVWVEIGYTHPLVEALKPTAGKSLLIRPPCEWTFLEEAPFHDIYEILEFTLPERKVCWEEAKATSRLTVPLRLAASGAAGQAELWVLHDRPLEQLDSLVRDNEDALIRHLAFAVAEHDGKTIVAVRARPSKQGPPVLVLEGQGYRPFWKLPNLFVPCGKGLHPPLRRDAVRKLLADDPDQITWLSPNSDGTFTPETLPDAAFRPLADWVDYVLDHDKQALQAWVGASCFEFESFICKDDASKRPPRPPRDKDSKRPGKKGETVEVEPVVPQLKVVKKTGRREAAGEFVSLPKEKPSELQQRLSEKETQFREAEGPLDMPERLALWPEMAALHTALNHPADAAVCWANSLWQTDDPPAAWARTWADAEGHLHQRPVSAADFDRLVGLADPSVPDIRALAACVLTAADGDSQKVLIERLPRVRDFLEKHENQLGIRTVWLAWVSLAKLSAGDVLGLARVRDRLLERLLARGLNPEYDLPSFLRFAGQHAGDRFRSVRDRMVRLCEAAHQWIVRSYKHAVAYNHVVEYTRAYANLIFAFGLARLGEGHECDRLLKMAKESLPGGDDAHSFLLQAFDYRARQALEGKPHAGPLPHEYLEELAFMGEDVRNRDPLYRIDRFREFSRILEPQEKINACRKFYSTDELGKELIALGYSTEREQIARQLTRLLDSAKEPRPHLEVLATAMSLAPRVGEAFAVDALNRLEAIQDRLPAVQDLNEFEARVVLLERALFLAAHYDHPEHVRSLIARFLALLRSSRVENTAQILDSLIGQSFRGLRKLGLRDEIDQLLHQMADMVQQGKNLESLRKSLGARWPGNLRALLQIAGGWLFFGRNEQAMPVLKEAEELLQREMYYVDRAKLACAYVAALGQADAEMASKRMLKLLLELPPINDLSTTSTHYSLRQLQVIEAVVLAVVSDDFNLGQNARRWLDEDEYLVRRRIHGDLRGLMAKAGL